MDEKAGEEKVKKAIKTLSPIIGVLSTLEAMAYPQSVDRSDVFNDKVGDIVIDTVCAFDTNTWETGIKKEKWTIVEQYETKEKAQKGHQDWIKKITKNPKLKLKDINLWNL